MKSLGERPAEGPDHPIPRRSFLGILTLLGGAVSGAALSIPLLRFIFYPVFQTASDILWSEVGALEEFALLAQPILKTIEVEQRDGWRKVTSQKAVYVVPQAGGPLKVLSPVCPHLGCLIGWHADKKIFVSPCHNGVFGPDGHLVSGPPRRAMDELESKIESGKLLVKYRYFRPLVEQKEAIG